MKLFQYRVEDINNNDTMDEALNYFGAKGWEIIKIIGPSSPHGVVLYTVFFKRPKTSKS